MEYSLMLKKSFLKEFLLSFWVKDTVFCECGNHKAYGTIYKNKNNHYEFLTSTENTDSIDSLILNSFRIKAWKHIYIDKFLSNSRYYPSDYPPEKKEYDLRKTFLDNSMR